MVKHGTAKSLLMLSIVIPTQQISIMTYSSFSSMQAQCPKHHQLHTSPAKGIAARATIGTIWALDRNIPKNINLEKTTKKHAYAYASMLVLGGGWRIMHKRCHARTNDLRDRRIIRCRKWHIVRSLNHILSGTLTVTASVSSHL